MLIEKTLNDLGLNAVEIYRKSFIDGDRVATGKTNQSISYQVKNSEGTTTLEVFGRKDINQLEEGVSASEYSSNPATLGALEEWIKARGLNRTAQSIDDGLRRNGWVSGDGPKGGTPNIITTPTNKIIQEAKIEVSNISRDYVLNLIKV